MKAKPITDREFLAGVLRERDALQAEVRHLKAAAVARRDPLAMGQQMVTIDIDNSTEGPLGTWRNIYAVDAACLPATLAETVMAAILATAEYSRGTRVRLSIQSRSIESRNTNLDMEGVVR